MNKNLFTIIDFKWVFSFMKMNFEEDYNENQIPKSAKITSEMLYWLFKGPYIF